MKKLIKWGLIGAAVVYVAGVAYNRWKYRGVGSPWAVAFRWPLSAVGL